MSITSYDSHPVQALPFLGSLPRGFPDPLLSVNVYCSGRLSELIHLAVAPFWRAFRSNGESGESYLWLMRYAKCGEHLKIRIHASESQRSLLHDLLSHALDSFFARLGPSLSNAQQHARDLATPIDREDSATSNYADRTLLWTHYARSHVSFGFQPFLQDDIYLALATQCLGKGTEILLDRFETDAERQYSHRSLQTLLLNVLMAGLSALSLSARERSIYLLYHRDWLLRSALKQGGTLGGPKKMSETLHLFEQHIEKLGSSVDRLGKRAELAWGNGGTEWDGNFAAWRQAIGEFSHYVVPLCRNPSFHIDPFAENPIFPPLFKVLHGFANQLGLSPLNEAFAHHLLLHATADNHIRHSPVRLVPLV